MKHAVACCVSLLVVAAVESPARGQDTHSLTIGEVVTLARARSAEARESRAVAESAAATSDAVVGGYLPTLRAEASGDRQYNHAYVPDFGTSNGFRGNPTASLGTSVGATLSWTAWDFGRTSSLVAGARATARAAEGRANASGNDASKNAALLFLAAIFDEELVRATHTTVQIYEKHANLSRSLVAAGLRPSIEEARARVELLRAKLEVTKAEQQLAQDKVRLATALFLDPREPMTLVRPAMLPTMVADARYAAEQALKNRPEVQAASNDVEASREAVDAARAQRLPSFGLNLSASHRTNQTDDDDRIFPTKNFTAAVTVSVPVFDWQVWGRIPAARANVVAAEARQAGVQARLQGEAAEATYAIRSAATLVEQAKAARDLASATLTVIEARYQAGRDGPFDLLEAAKADAAARVESVRAEMALATATVGALAAAGRINELTR